MAAPELMDATEYRKRVTAIFEHVLHAFDDIDPDVAEADLSQGSLTILGRGKKVILSPQPPVRQVWVAAAALGRALHFSWDTARQAWMDDKNTGLELLAFTEDVVRQTAGDCPPLR